MPNEEPRRTPDDEGWRWENKQDGEWNHQDVGYSDIHSDGSSSEAFRVVQGETNDGRQGYFDGVVAQQTTQDSKTELLAGRESFNEDEQTYEFDIALARHSEIDENGVESPRIEILSASERRDFGGLPGYGYEAQGTLLGIASDDVEVDVAKFQFGAFTDNGRTTLSGEANIFSLGFGQQTDVDEAQLGLEAGVGGTVELYHGEDTDRDGYGEWGAKFPLILNRRANQAIENFTGRVFGRPIDLSISFRLEPERYWNSAVEFFTGRPSGTKERIGSRMQSMEMSHISSAFARLQSLL